jgi:hypothetical protein
MTVFSVQLPGTVKVVENNDCGDYIKILWRLKTFNR